MIPEQDYKERFIKILNSREVGWIDGDRELVIGKRVDVINHKLKIAIEIKDDTNYKVIPDGQAHTQDLSLMNKRLADQVRSANNKFKSYSAYRTILLLRSEYIPDTLHYALEGLDQFRLSNEQRVYVGKVGKYTEFAKNEVGGFLIVTHRIIYSANYLAKKHRVVPFEEVEKLTGWKIEHPK